MIGTGCYSSKKLRANEKLELFAFDNDYVVMLQFDDGQIFFKNHIYCLELEDINFICEILKVKKWSGENWNLNKKESVYCDQIPIQSIDRNQNGLIINGLLNDSISIELNIKKNKHFFLVLPKFYRSIQNDTSPVPGLNYDIPYFTKEQMRSFEKLKSQSNLNNKEKEEIENISKSIKNQHSKFNGYEIFPFNTSFFTNNKTLHLTKWYVKNGYNPLF